MQARRLRRDEQVERNREQLLAAARQVFLERGFHAATLEAIAEAAGFSKGVVYSQFASKADLFLALLERRIDERAVENERLAARTAGPGGVADLLSLAERTAVSEPAWELLVLEFRVHAARDPALNARYARAHARTVERLAAVLRRHLEGTEIARSHAPEAMALFVLAVGTGTALESVATPDALASGDILGMLSRALGVAPGAASAARGTRRLR